MIRLFAPVLAALLLAGCGLIPQPTMVLMANPDTGATARCKSLVRSSEEPILPLFTSRNLDNCVRQYEALGFVRAENFNSQQKEVASKPAAQRIEQDITVKQESGK
jgi:hypothetical protein